MEQNLESLIKSHAGMMADQMVKAVEWAGSEEDIRHECNKLIDEFLKKSGLNVKVRGQHEYSLGRGAIDSKYGGVIIEYKDPHGAGKITEDKNAPGVKNVVAQIKGRFRDFQAEENIGPERIFAVGCDGDTFVFVRYRGREVEVENPQPVTPHSVERLLRALVSLGAKGYSFTPENLCDHFGGEGDIALNGIARIYEVISTTNSPKAQLFFKQWQILFGEVCGYDVHGQSTKIRTLGEHYHIPDAKPAELLFSVHTYYGILIKLLAAEIVSSFSLMGTSFLKKLIAAPTSTKLRSELDTIEQGGIWTQQGIRNFLEGDLFSWYLDAWDERLEEAVRSMVTTLDKYDPTTLSVEPAESRDLLKKLYQHLFPKSVRHDLGEYYTPDWLADLTLKELGYDGNPDKRLLDPACGSGTFLVMTINRIKAWFVEHRHECGFGEDILLKKILSNVIGFDLNPLAIMTARTNYLLAIRDLLHHGGDIELPIYLCDSIMTPSEYGGLFVDEHAAGEFGATRQLKTSAGTFFIPTEVTGKREEIGKYADALELCIRNKNKPDDFIKYCKAEGISVDEETLHKELFQKLMTLDGNNQNGIWARIIKNAFAPLFVGRVHLIAGNPPWVNWENLPGGYKQDVRNTMQQYGLMSAKGWSARLGSAKYDLSMLFVYASIDNFLDNNGKLAFVITQSVFQSDAGTGFRRFKFQKGEGVINFSPLVVHDMTSFQPFELASNRTSVVVFKGSSKPHYPVCYKIWNCVKPINPDMRLEDVEKIVEIKIEEAKPVENSRPNSRWLIGSGNVETVLQKVLGRSDYTAQLGSNTEGANGVFWVTILSSVGAKHVIVENVTKGLKRPVPKVAERIEKKFIRPLIRSGDIKKWCYHEEAYLLFMSKHFRREIDEPLIKTDCPYLYSYFEKFREVLITRKSYVGKMKMQGYPFYTIYGSDVMQAPYKVVWKRMGSTVDAVVVESYDDDYLGQVSPIPQETIVYIPFSDEMEAHYVCAMINSSFVTFLAQRYSLKGSKSFASVHLLENIKIPRYDVRASFHKKLADLSIGCHRAVRTSDQGHLDSAEKEIDKIAAEVWSITPTELEMVRKMHKKD